MCIHAYHNNVYVFFQALEDEDKMTPEQLAIKNVGKQVDLFNKRL